jgi:peptide chain release factor 1
VEVSERELLFSLSKAKGDFVVTCARSSGPGGQNVNKRSTKVHITHPASGAKAECQTHRTQERNRSEAFKRLVEGETFQAWLRLELARRGVETPQEHGGIGPTGSRGEKVRTYHFPRDQVTDHRVGLTVTGVKRVLDGDLDEFVEALTKARHET